MKIKVKTSSKDETINLAKRISKYFFPGSVVTLNGDLGAGKTTFAKGVGLALNIEEEINSPTFNILKCYFHEPLSLFHIDAYRLEDVPEENKNIGLDEIIEGDGVTLIEWSHFIDEFINPMTTLDITIEIDEDNNRVFTFESKNKAYESLFEELKNVQFNFRQQ